MKTKKVALKFAIKLQISEKKLHLVTKAAEFLLQRQWNSLLQESLLGRTVNKEYYLGLLRNLLEAIRNKRLNLCVCNFLRKL